MLGTFCHRLSIATRIDSLYAGDFIGHSFDRKVSDRQVAQSNYTKLRNGYAIS